MSIETLLDALAVPPVPPKESAGEPLEPPSTLAGAPGSLGSPRKTSTLDEDLVRACHALVITPSEMHDSLAPEDIEDCRKGDISDETLTAFARSLVHRREMDQGKVPTHFTEHAICKHCGPIWLWFAGVVQGCPWCWNRVAGRPIPRPKPVQCGDCAHFERIAHPHLGHCAKDEPEAIAGLWDTDRRICLRWLPLAPGPGAHAYV